MLIKRYWVLIGVIVLIGIIGGGMFIIFFTPFRPPKAYDSRIILCMDQLQTAASMFFEEEGTYLGFRCETSITTRAICRDIQDNKHAQSKPIIHTAPEAFCSYVKIVEGKQKGNYCCVDNTGDTRITQINPGSERYCNGKTFLCPE